MTKCLKHSKLSHVIQSNRATKSRLILSSYLVAYRNFVKIVCNTFINNHLNPGKGKKALRFEE